MLSVNQLHKEIEKRETKKSQTYQSVLEKCYERIKTVNSKSNDCYCLYICPTFIFGFPLYNITNCIIYIMNDLIKNGFKVIYTHPNLLYISWKENIKQPNHQLKAIEDEFRLLENDLNKPELIYHPTDIKSIGSKTDYLFSGLENL